MNGVEFVDREFAEAEAARAIGLLDTSDESKIEGWRAMQAVANQIGPESNVGIRGLSWASNGAQCVYNLSANCVDGWVREKTGAPTLLEEARMPSNRDRAKKLLDRLVQEKGGLQDPDRRPRGTGDALVAAVSASTVGARWVDAHSSARDLLLRMVKVVDRYGSDGLNPRASLGAHYAFIEFAERKQLVREFPSASAARAKSLSLRGTNIKVGRPGSPKPPRRLVVRLAARSGVTESEARIILAGKMDGRSKTQWLRAVKEAYDMVTA